jgi:DNA-binding NarL/FixJ family response regulator
VESRDPIRISIVDDYDVVVQGLARMFEPFKERIQVVEVSTNRPEVERVDIALIDSFALTRDVNEVLAETNAERYVFYSWSLEPDLIETWTRFGVVGFLDKRLTAEQLADALERIHRGHSGVVSAEYPDSPDVDLGDWPGREHGLSAREAEVIALITQGLGNDEIAERMYTSINTVKTYIRTAYRKIGVDSRTRAVLWGVDNDFRPDTISAKPAPTRAQPPAQSLPVRAASRPDTFRCDSQGRSHARRLPFRCHRCVGPTCGSRPASRLPSTKTSASGLSEGR